ncbi:EamA-like transporter family protein [Desulfofustis glycolicus DSM 9705]|uniref:EamA-like transporter family protein n=2 Tax=Desulfofustis glycolicus TaxID=51195 RepID=A0A1M5XW28_9BACT|nr:EamA-like transporter family protein [Desulfofustis glycolicus DSM 9705]
MPLEVLLIVLLAALLHASWNALIRASSHNLQDTCLLVVGAAFWTLFLIPFLPLPQSESWNYLALSVVLHVIYFVLLAVCYRFGQLSFSYPMMRGIAPVITALAMALLYGESPSVGAWLGIGCICGGIVLLSGDAWRAKSLDWATVGPVLATAAIIVCYTLVDGHGVRLAGHALAYTSWLFLLTAAVFIVLSALLGRIASWRRTRIQWARGLVGGACSLASYGLVLWAMMRAPIALVAALRETSVVIAAIIAVCCLGERLTWLRVLSICTVTAGAVVIKII